MLAITTSTSIVLHSFWFHYYDEFANRGSDVGIFYSKLFSTYRQFLSLLPSSWPPISTLSHYSRGNALCYRSLGDLTDPFNYLDID
jgi:hypothetical protein